jgi:Major tropism determinant N-terminal domain
MSTTLQFRRYNTATTNSTTGAAGELTVNTDLNTLVVHDGSTAGGFQLATQSNVNSIAAGGINLTNFSGNIIPSASNTYNLGTTGSRFNSLNLGPTGININGATIGGNGTLSFVNSSANVSVFSGAVSLLTSGDGVKITSGNITVSPGTGSSWNFYSNSAVAFPDSSVQSTAYPGVVNSIPASSKGQTGDKKGMIASDGLYLYVCYTNYTTGTNNIWAKVATVGQTW